MSITSNMVQLKDEKLKIVYCAANLILSLVSLLPAFTVWGLVRSVLVVAIVFAIVAAGDKERPVCSYLCWFFAMQCLVYVAVHWDGLAAAIDTNAFKSIAAAMRNNGLSFLLIYTGIGAGIVGLFSKKHNITWLLGLGCGLIGLGFLQPMWLQGITSTAIVFAENGRAVLVMYILLVLCWTTCMYVVTQVLPSLRMECIWLTFFLFGVAMVINISCGSYVHSIAGDLHRFFLSLPDGLFSWWRVVLTYAALFTLYILVQEHATNLVDSLFMLLCANTLLAIRILMSFYSTFSWILFALFVVLALHALRNESNAEVVFRREADEFLVIEVLAFVMFALLLCFGLWANVVVTALFMMLFYIEWEKIQVNPSGNWRWISITSLLVAEAFARMATWRYSVEGCIMLGLVWAMAVAVIFIINREHPAGVVPGSRWHAIVAVCVAVMCLASLRSPVSVNATTQDNLVQIEVTADGGNNRATAKCYWSNGFGKRVTSEQRLVGTTSNIPIVSDVLTVVATDTKGVTCTRRFFYAPWVHEQTRAEESAATENVTADKTPETPETPTPAA